MADITLPLAFVAGLVSFLSPCVLPLIPAFLTFIAGTTLQQGKAITQDERMKIIIASFFFVLGFSTVFAVLGVLLQSVLEAYAYDVRNYLGYVGGIVIIFFGLVMLGIVKIPFLEQEHKLRVKETRYSFLTAFLFGAAFAVGWTPCVGAVLGAVLTLAVTNPTTAFPLMLAYALGLGIPFLLVGIFISQAQGVINYLAPHLKTLNLIFGVVLVLMGILVFTGNLVVVANLFSPVQMIFGG
ncbi:MAG: cytochrome C biogenesis protein [Candidatus Iainarchaeum archaeon]|uniref:Cytochrome C biogenesis protein n=1 Tax=Candidatus Iainarchaeum sp. TaxID=3101447 RepID=A0A7T9I2H5_9ARCH|nr:MAG: cytochrome C biogenesis protein [Candidatus Diapherotrites archaeon]